LANHGLEQLAEHRTRAQRIGVGQGRARYRTAADMIEPGRLALQPGHDLPQAYRPGQLAIQQRDELALRRQTPHTTIRLMHFDQPVEFTPWNPLQQIVEHAIVMPHGVAPFVSR
jgi:hypothetical protein